ncbi:hypothetical protein [Flavobacterium sp. NKUCC04_CG]|uniref:hypothetical protein n=1 Tax=Flavobacterium sp. NKUCC04_CG TaxID=2842121 RepID=UPI001C5BB85D|nr:hypothetical protein [Flavobacterium sp. NKUCC04_CG]MBW3519518.1 hypothetical protein [Flavobacterium sp. NKUCC04_CG]
MDFKILAKTVAAVKAFLGIKEIPIDTDALTTQFTDAQKVQLQAHFGDDFTEKMIDAIDIEIKNVLQNKADLETIQEEIKALEVMVSANENMDESDPPVSTDVLESLKELKAQFKQQKELMAILMEEPEVETSPLQTQLMKNVALLHSPTHLFASGKSWDAFEKRSWNARLRDFSMKATDFNKEGNIPLLQDDVEHFVRQNPEALNSLFNDTYSLPAEWSRRTGVLDRVADGYIIPAEIVQGRSKGWKPKNRFHIAAEEGRVFRKKIDITFDGYELQKIENTWIRSYNKEGSHPWKMSFVFFLLSELVKRQAADDRIAQINGIYVATPDGDGNPGAAINSQDGLMYYWYYFRDVAKKYRAFDIGRPTPENIVDYIKTMIEKIPETERNEQGNEIQISSTLMHWYRERAGFLYQHHYNTDSGKQEYKENHPIDYPNFKFQVLRDMTQTEFIGITQSTNVEVLDYQVDEKGKFTITHEKRDTHIFADYRLGIRLVFVGTKLQDEDPREFEVQKVWSNSVPIFHSGVKIPVFDDTSGIIQLHYPSIQVDADWRTDITSIEEALPGQIIRIFGNKKLQTAKKVKKNTSLLLTSDYPLNTDGVLTLLVTDEGKLKEVSRTTTAKLLVTDVPFEDDVIDVTSGNKFVYQGEVSTTIKSIIGGVEGKTIKVFGNDKVDVVVTIKNTDSIKISEAVELKTSQHYIELVFIENVWIELKRAI